MTPSVKELFAALDALCKQESSITRLRAKAHALRFLDSDPALFVPSLRAQWIDFQPGGFAVWMTPGGRRLYCRADWEKGRSLEVCWVLPQHLRPGAKPIEDWRLP